MVRSKRTQGEQVLVLHRPGGFQVEATVATPVCAWLLRDLVLVCVDCQLFAIRHTFCVRLFARACASVPRQFLRLLFAFFARFSCLHHFEGSVLVAGRATGEGHCARAAMVPASSGHLARVLRDLACLG